jgi:hypothetical protein
MLVAHLCAVIGGAQALVVVVSAWLECDTLFLYAFLSDGTASVYLSLMASC